MQKMAKIIKADVYLEVYESEQELDQASRELLQKAREACHSAYAPYSGFHVGAAVLLENGVVVSGANQENAAYPSGLCAERVALFAASAQYPGVKMRKLAIAARKKEATEFVYATPCGSCRQVMNEYEMKFDDSLQILLQGEEQRIYVAPSVDTFLPFSFSKKALI
jgi:cytidine deaminase